MTLSYSNPAPAPPAGDDGGLSTLDWALIIIGILVVIILIALAAAGGYFFYQKKKRESYAEF